MKQSNRIIRRETPADYAAVERLTREALEQTAVGEETVLTGGAERLRAVPLPQESSKTRGPRFKTLCLKDFDSAAGVIHMVDVVVPIPCAVVSSAYGACQALDPASIARCRFSCVVDRDDVAHPANLTVLNRHAVPFCHGHHFVSGKADKQIVQHAAVSSVVTSKGAWESCFSRLKSSAVQLVGLV